VLLRVHNGGQCDLINQEAELATFLRSSELQLGPRLLLLFQNGRVEEFLTQHHAATPALLKKHASGIAEALADFHYRMVRPGDSVSISAWVLCCSTGVPRY
jgi:Choline/ethanolamine kinase